MPAGETLLTLSATDEDSGSNGVSIFETNLAAVTDQRVLQLLSLDRKSGRLSLKTDLTLRDLRTSTSGSGVESLYYPVIVTDEAVPSERKTSTATLTIVAGTTEPG